MATYNVTIDNSLDKYALEAVKQRGESSIENYLTKHLTAMAKHNVDETYKEKVSDKVSIPDKINQIQ